MIPDHVLQERKDNARSHARPNTPEQEADDLELMERLYQEDLKGEPSHQALQGAALKLINEQILSRGGKMPSPEAVEVAAKILARRAMRETKQG